MRIALAQLDFTVGDLDGNVALHLKALAEATARGAELVVFSELSLPGYPPQDLLERRGFVAAQLEALQRLAARTSEVAMLVGFARPRPPGPGKRLANAAALLVGGRVDQVVGKTLLPTYDVFDERRWFEPARLRVPITWRGERLGVTICEDIWNVPGYVDEAYEVDPVAELVAAGAGIIINLSASPFGLHKRHARPEMLATQARTHGRPLVFVNQVGGNDELVFDGHSLACDARGAIVARAAELEEDLVLVDTGSSAGEVRAPAATDEEAIVRALTLGTAGYARKCGFSRAVLGLSGGIDSALVAAVACRALGPANVLGVAMPSRFSSQGSLDDARALAANLGMALIELPIEPLYGAFLDALAPHLGDRGFDTTEENLQARIRGVLLMALSNKHGHLLLTTGNKSELATGYCTLYGDMAGGLAMISDVPKTLVFALARHLNREHEVIPWTILDKPPSAELRPDQKDEDSLPPYPVLDAVLDLMIEQELDGPAIAARGFDPQMVAFVARLVRTNEYKRRQAAPGLKITSKAFGPGRRMPLAQRWSG